VSRFASPARGVPSPWIPMTKLANSSPSRATSSRDAPLDLARETLGSAPRGVPGGVPAAITRQPKNRPNRPFEASLGFWSGRESSTPTEGVRSRQARGRLDLLGQARGPSAGASRILGESLEAHRLERGDRSREALVAGTGGSFSTWRIVLTGLELLNGGRPVMTS